MKAVPLHHKNPAQHAHDLDVIETYEEIKPVFFNSVTGKRKSKICARVDGGHDEGHYIWKCSFGGLITI